MFVSPAVRRGRRGQADAWPQRGRLGCWHRGDAVWRAFVVRRSSSAQCSLPEPPPLPSFARPRLPHCVGEAKIGLRDSRLVRGGGCVDSWVEESAALGWRGGVDAETLAVNDDLVVEPAQGGQVLRIRATIARPRNHVMDLEAIPGDAARNGADGAGPPGSCVPTPTVCHPTFGR